MKHKKIIIAALVAVSAVGMCMARPGRGHHRGGHHHHHHSAWGRGGRNFWPGFLGGVAAGIVADSIINRPAVVTTTPVVATPAPVVVTQPAPVVVTPPAPVYQTQNVWVEGQYVDQVQANGAVVRTWVPGHYEQRTVQVQ